VKVGLRHIASQHGGHSHRLRRHNTLFLRAKILFNVFSSPNDNFNF